VTGLQLFDRLLLDADCAINNGNCMRLSASALVAPGLQSVFACVIRKKVRRVPFAQ
jgi:hypothetical protein